MAMRSRDAVQVPEETRPALHRERRYIYGGEAKPALPVQAARANRRPDKRRMSTFNLILIIFGFGVAIVLYVNNILAVNQLAQEVGQLRARYDALENANKNLKAELTKKSEHERIGTIATRDLNMRDPVEPAQTLEVDRTLQDNLSADEQAR